MARRTLATRPTDLARPLLAPADLDPLLERVGDARYVLLRCGRWPPRPPRRPRNSTVSLRRLSHEPPIPADGPLRSPGLPRFSPCSAGGT
ncbi:MAG: hypothetical protein M3467_06985, partial [Actinomycetota bacterium]|nr:hypothetical protein [Actinomycetota bacterium]